MKDLKNKIVFITGASSGFGKACAEQFAVLGANLLICARRAERIEKIAFELHKNYKIKVFAFQLDVRNQEDVDEMIGGLPTEWKKIEVLVNNAGLSRGLNKIQDGVLLDWEEMIDTNVKGLLYVSRAVIPLMLKNKRGHIINIGSIAGQEVYPAGNVYCASKHAVDALTKGMRIDLNDTPIKVSTVDPGLAETEFSLVRFRGDKERAKNVYKGLKPLTAADVAEIVVFAATRNEHINLAQVLLLPKCQANTTLVKRN
ncbi:MAG: SDR family NAD(P)-dependent oxidoreductase [Ignavibacteria bacterium]|nr:SDR family NAD(P)-dependent oxidoreductase [Ignavibacteria bacterium]